MIAPQQPAGLDVSRETRAHLDSYVEMLTTWQKTINLVAPSTIEHAWTRHIVDSAQLLDLAPPTSKSWLDLGSGGGFPGLVIAILAVERQPDLQVTLVESDIRKCGFLREVARKTGTSVNILSRRIEDIPRQAADVISARALANLPRLVQLAERHLTDKTVMLFPKGASHAEEVAALPNEWQTKVTIIESVTQSDAVIVRIAEPVDPGNE